MTVSSVTTAMQAKAAVLLEGAAHWSRGTRTSDGQPFVLFTGSKGAVYFTSALGCTCPGYLRRGVCSHVLAVRLADVGHDELATEAEIDAECAGIRADAEWQAGTERRRRSAATFERLFPANDFA